MTGYIVVFILGGLFGFGFADLFPRSVAWFNRRKEANKLKYAQALVDKFNAELKAVEDAKALLKASLPPIPANPVPAGNTPPAAPTV